MRSCPPTKSRSAESDRLSQYRSRFTRVIDKHGRSTLKYKCIALSDGHQQNSTCCYTAPSMRSTYNPLPPVQQYLSFMMHYNVARTPKPCYTPSDISEPDLSHFLAAALAFWSSDVVDRSNFPSTAASTPSSRSSSPASTSSSSTWSWNSPRSSSGSIFIYGVEL